MYFKVGHTSWTYLSPTKRDQDWCAITKSTCICYTATVLLEKLASLWLTYIQTSYHLCLPQPPYKDIAQSCNLWRNYADIGDSWSSVSSIIEWFSKDDGNFTQVAGPGKWNDPDMVSRSLVCLRRTQYLCIAIYCLEICTSVLMLHDWFAS